MNLFCTRGFFPDVEVLWRCVAQCAVFREACRAQAVQKLLVEHATELTFTYMLYSGMDTSTEVPLHTHHLVSVWRRHTHLTPAVCSFPSLAPA